MQSTDLNRIGKAFTLNTQKDYVDFNLLFKWDNWKVCKH